MNSVHRAVHSLGIVIALAALNNCSSDLTGSNEPASAFPVDPTSVVASGGFAGGGTNVGPGIGGAGTLGPEGDAGGPPGLTPTPGGQVTGVQPPEAYVAKVKSLVNGGVPTDAEIAQVKSDPVALRSLIDEWMRHPIFQHKITTFLAEALQQVGFDEDALKTGQLPELSKPTSDWNQQLMEMFPRTAWDIVEKGRPFTEIATTRRFMATTSVLITLKYLELSEEEAEEKPFWVYHNDLPNNVKRPNTLAESIALGVFQLPENPSGRCPYPRQINHDWLFRVLTGMHLCTITPISKPLVTAADTNDWRMVEFQDASGDSGVPYYDLINLRKANSIQLKQQRVGFFTTPAFFARNDTNEDNDFRVTTNQALIVGLGRAFDDQDVTIPFRTSAVEEEHAAPGTACYGCHVSLDPMRNYFANVFEPTYRARKAPGNDETSFGFGGEKLDGGDLIALGQAIATHPAFATGWAQKLCRWANSQSCLETDPEFQRVAKAFVDSNYDFKTLVRELLASPLVTAATETKTQKELNGTIVSIARRAHLCGALEHRLDIPNLCKERPVEITLDVIPEDQFARGDDSAAVPASPSLLLTGGVTSFCSTVANLVVNPSSDLNRFDVATPEASVEKMARLVLGIPTQDPRYAPLLRILQKHYQAANDSGAGTSGALRSTFRMACESPTATSLGN